MPAIRELLRDAVESRANVWSEYRSLLESISGSPTGEESAALERMDQTLSERTAEIERLERALTFESASTTPEREPVLDRPGGGGDSPELRAAFSRYIRTGNPAGLEYRALAVGTESAGGYAVPDGFRAEIQQTMVSFGGVREVATTITTDTGANLEWPTFDGTAQRGVIIAENSQVTELDPTFGIASLDSYLWSSRMVRVPLQLLQDSAINMEQFLRDALAERIARAQNTSFTTGTGTGEPDGVVTGATVGVTAASATAVTADEILRLTYSIDPAYRTGAVFMMNDAIVGSIRRMTDANGAFIWQPSLQAGTPDALAGYPVVVNNDMDGAPAANDVVALFGNFRRYYVIRDVRGFELMVLREKFADFHQTGYLGFQRTDGTKADMAAVRALRMAAA